MKMKTTDFVSQFSDYLIENFSGGNFDLSNGEAVEYAKDFLRDRLLYHIEEIELDDFDIDEANEAIHEYADGLVDIYNQDLYEKSWQFSEWTEKALDEYGYDNSIGLVGVLMAGQYMYYEELFYSIISEMEDFINTINE